MFLWARDTMRQYDACASKHDQTVEAFPKE
jgi:hypothetical protein